MTEGNNPPQTRGSRQGNGRVAESEPHCIHLLAAVGELLAECHRHRSYLALCGELLEVAELPGSLREDECDREIMYWLTDGHPARVHRQAR